MYPRTLVALVALLAPSTAWAEDASATRLRALLVAIERIQGRVPDACPDAIDTERLPRAESFGRARSLAWPGDAGTRSTPVDRLRARLQGPARAACLLPPRVHGGGVLAASHFQLEVPAGFQVWTGAAWLLARSPDGRQVIEVSSYPARLPPRELAAREQSLLARDRRVDASVSRLRDAPEDRAEDAFTLELRYDADGRDFPARASWVRLDRGRVARLVVVVEASVSFDDPAALRRPAATIRPAADPIAPPNHPVDTPPETGSP